MLLLEEFLVEDVCVECISFIMKVEMKTMGLKNIRPLLNCCVKFKN